MFEDEGAGQGSTLDSSMDGEDQSDSSRTFHAQWMAPYGRASRELHVSNLPESATEAEVRAMLLRLNTEGMDFVELCSIRSSRAAPDDEDEFDNNQGGGGGRVMGGRLPSSSGPVRTWAHVVMKDPWEAAYAVGYSSAAAASDQGRLTLRGGEGAGGGGSGGSGGSGQNAPNPAHEIFISWFLTSARLKVLDIPVMVKAEELEKAFAQWGDCKVSLERHLVTGESRGEATVEYSRRGVATLVVEILHHNLFMMRGTLRPLRAAFYTAHELREGRGGAYEKAQEAVAEALVKADEGGDGAAEHEAEREAAEAQAAAVAAAMPGAEMGRNRDIPPYKVTVRDFHIETHAQPHFAMPKVCVVRSITTRTRN